MGKNQAHKQMQRARMSTSTAGAEEGEVDKLDATFHSPEWHAARLAALQTTSTITWEEYKKKQKEDARLQSELDDAEEKRMREYRAQLDAERAARLAKGRNHADKRDKVSLEKKKSKRKEKGKEKERKHKKDSKSKKEKRRHRRDSSESDSETSSDASSDQEKRRRKSKKDKDSRHKKRRRHSSSSDSSSANDENGPVRLSSFFDGE